MGRGLLCPKARPPNCSLCPFCKTRRPSSCPNARKATLWEPPSSKLLFAQTQLLDQCVVSLHIFLLEIGEQIAALIHHHQQTTTRMVVLVVGLEVFGEVLDALCQDRDLDFGAARIAIGLCVVL